MEIWRHENVEKLENGHMEIERRGNKETRKQETWKHCELIYGDIEIWSHGNTKTWKHGDIETRKYGNMETWKYGDMETWGH
jgi:hypothetical protein